MSASVAGGLRMRRRRLVRTPSSFFPGTDQRTDFIDTLPQRRGLGLAGGMLRLLAWPLAAAAVAAGVMLWNQQLPPAPDAAGAPGTAGTPPLAGTARPATGAGTAAPHAATGAVVHGAVTPAAPATPTMATPDRAIPAIAAPMTVPSTAPVTATAEAAPAPLAAAAATPVRPPDTPTPASTAPGLTRVLNTGPATAAADPARPAVEAPVVGATQRRVTGVLVPWQEAVVAAEAGGGRVTELHVQPGDRVQRGQVLAVLDGGLAQAEMGRLQAQVQLARATLAEAQAVAQGVRSVQGSGAFSRQQEQQYFAAEGLAQARLEQAQAAVRLQQQRLRQLSLVAPVAGVVAQRLVDLGSVLSGGQPVYRLIRDGRLEWQGELPAEDLPRLQPGSALRLTLSNGEVVEGTVRQVSPVVDPHTRLGRIRADLPPHAQLRAGAPARAELLLQPAGNGA